MSKSKRIIVKATDAPVYGTVVRSCDRCKEKKVRCNNAVPCNHCMSHGAMCTYNTPYRRKRYAISKADEQHKEDVELKIKSLEEQLLEYKEKIIVLEQSLLKYISPVPTEGFSLVACAPISHADQLVDIYYDAGRWVCSHFDKMFDEIRSRNTRSKELTWQLVNSFNKHYVVDHINQLTTEGLIEILSWINVFLLGDMLTDNITVQNDMINIAVSIVTTLFFNRGIQFDAVPAQNMIGNLVMLSSYLQLSNRMAAYMTIIGFLMQLVQLYEDSMEASLVFSTYSALLLTTIDKSRRDSWMLKYYSQLASPPLIENVKFQLSSCMSALLLGEIYSTQSLRMMIASIREIDESIQPLKGTQIYNFLKTWVCAAEAEFACNLDDLECYEAKKLEAIDHYNLMTSTTYRTRMTTLFNLILLLVDSRGLQFKGSSFAIFQSPIKSDEQYTFESYSC